jgi:hypothetical protein
VTAPLLRPLVCPRCGAPLEGGPRARIFLCRPCQLATYGADPAQAVPLRYVGAVKEFGAPDLHAPFWRVEGEFRWQVEDASKARVYAKLVPLGPLFFPAFTSPKTAYCDDITLRYARRPELLVPRPGDAPLLDGGRNPAVLGELSRLAWLAYLDRVADVTGVEGRFDVRALTYVGVPFCRRENHFVDAVLGIQVPEVYFDL